MLKKEKKRAADAMSQLERTGLPALRSSSRNGDVPLVNGHSGNNGNSNGNYGSEHDNNGNRPKSSRHHMSAGDQSHKGNVDESKHNPHKEQLKREKEQRQQKKICR